MWRPSDGTWNVLLSSTGFDPGKALIQQWGAPGDIPMQSTDFDGEHLAPATIRHRRYKLTLIAQQTEWSTLANITAEAVQKHLQRLHDQGRAPATTNAYQDTLSAFLSWCKTQGWIPAHPLKGNLARASTKRHRPYRRRAFTEDELRQLLSVAGQHRTRYLVAALTGLRLKELHAVEARDFNLLAQTWTCRAEVDKTAQTWTLPLLPDIIPTLADHLKNLKPTDRLFPVPMGQSTFNNALKRAHLTKITPDGRRLNFHSLRYFYCTLLAKNLRIQLVKRLMRHNDIRRTDNLYNDLGLTDIATEIIRLPSLFPTKHPPADPPADT